MHHGGTEHGWTISRPLRVVAGGLVLSGTKDFCKWFARPLRSTAADRDYGAMRMFWTSRCRACTSISANHEPLGTSWVKIVSL
jgi:hypothetical protein